MPRWGDISPGRIQVTPPAPLVRAGDGTDRPGLRGGGEDGVVTRRTVASPWLLAVPGSRAARATCPPEGVKARKPSFCSIALTSVSGVAGVLRGAEPRRAAHGTLLKATCRLGSAFLSLSFRRYRRFSNCR